MARPAEQLLVSEREVDTLPHQPSPEAVMVLTALIGCMVVAEGAFPPPRRPDQHESEGTARHSADARAIRE